MPFDKPFFGGGDDQRLRVSGILCYSIYGIRDNPEISGTSFGGSGIYAFALRGNGVYEELTLYSFVRERDIAFHDPNLAFQPQTNELLLHFISKDLKTLEEQATPLRPC